MGPTRFHPHFACIATPFTDHAEVRAALQPRGGGKGASGWAQLPPNTVNLYRDARNAYVASDASVELVKGCVRNASKVCEDLLAKRGEYEAIVAADFE